MTNKSKSSSSIKGEGVTYFYNNVYIGIAGNIGSGKTTLTKMLAKI